MDPETFRRVLGRFASGITIVTAVDETGTDCGMTITAFSSVSLHPPLVMVCVSHDATMYDLMMRQDAFNVSILSDQQEAHSRRFADKEGERFDGLAYRRSANGAVLIDDAAAHLECRVIQRHEAGDHTILVASVERATAADARPLVYYRGAYSHLER